MSDEKKASLGIEEEGNTDTSSSSSNAKKQGTKRMFWCGTLHGYEEIGIKVIEDRLKAFCTKYILGKEVCPTTGRKHLQMFFVCKKAMRLTEFKIPGKPHLEPCNADEETNIKYCSKDGDFIKFGFPKPIWIIKDLYPWQKEIEDYILTEPDGRTIRWYWEPKGNVGKSAFVKYLVVTHGVLFCQGGKESDIMNLVYNQDMDKCNTVVFDIPRAHGGNVSYAALENIKNGLVCNTKYETGYKVFNWPHIICFANFPPSKQDLVSTDKWDIRFIGDEMALDEV